MKKRAIQAVIFSQNLSFLCLLRDPLLEIGISVSCTGVSEDFLNLFLSKMPDLIVFDAEDTPPDLLSELDRLLTGTTMRLILVCATKVPNLSKQIESDRFRLLRKPIQLSDYRNTIVELIEIIERGSSPIGDKLSLKSSLYAGPDTGIIFTSVQMRFVNEFIIQASRSNYPVIIHGETGTEVEAVAQAIHRLKHGNLDSFQIIYCASLPDRTQEGVIFAKSKGQSTNSIAPDTICLHNIHEMPMALQGKLMRLLKNIRMSTMQTNDLFIPRYIASLDTPPEQSIAQGVLRSDVYHMLNVLSVNIPPLRERKEDIFPLMRDRFRRNNKWDVRMPEIEDEAAKLLTRYPWPGNTLELENFVTRVLLGSNRIVLKAQDLPAEISSFTNKSQIKASESTSIALEDNPVTLGVFEERTERNYILGVLSAFGGNKETTAARLGISIATFYRKLPHDDSVQCADQILPENIVSLKDYMQHQKAVYIAHVLDLAQNDKMKAAQILGVSLAALYRMRKLS